MNKQPINPVTIQPTQKRAFALTIGRMHVGVGGQPMDKLVTFVIWDTTIPPEQAMLKACHAVIDEDQLVDALGHLFPHGELSKAHEIP